MVRIFRHYVPGSLVLLGVAEALVLALSVHGGTALWTFETGGTSKELVEFLGLKSVLFAVVMLSSLTAMGLYWRDLRVSTLWLILLRVVGAFFLGILVLTILFYVVPFVLIGRGALFNAVVLSFAGVIAARTVHHFVADHEAMKKRVLVVGAGTNASQIETLRRKTDWHGFRLVGYFHIPGEHDVVSPDKILDRDRPLLDLVNDCQVDELVVAIDDRRKAFPVDEILECKMRGLEVLDLITFFERQTRKIKLEALHPSSLIFSDGFSKAVLKNYSKRIFDLLSSLVLLAVVWPFMLVTAGAIWLESGGPILFRQTRVGRNSKPFNVLKFRSMRVDAEKDGEAKWAEKDDPRVTKVGKVIRKFRIDELPQLLNVLRGEMSFVGPRPERPEFVEQLAKEIPFYHLRHKVNPGITGWAQISYPYGASRQDAVEKLQYDLYYIKNYSLLFDLVILFQTAYAVLGGRGAR